MSINYDVCHFVSLGNNPTALSLCWQTASQEFKHRNSLFFPKTFRLSSLTRVYVYIKERENACKYKVLEKKHEGQKSEFCKICDNTLAEHVCMNSSFCGS